MAVSVRRRAFSEYLLAECAAEDAVKDVVRITGPSAAGLYQVAKLDIAHSDIEIALGVIIAKPSATRCTVQVGGQISGLYTGLTPGEMLFVGDDGQLTHTVPARPASGQKSIYQAALAIDADELLLNFQAPYRVIPQ